ncbi:peptidylprolyl isomerase [Adlercreutzia equolifaciens]|uniref:peptidylprolyl isomerase n=1 Tax=Adlercreutzia equolifaciens TaxID=446660 RepID=UPI0023AF10A2|nr:peptidylprolyl isomerase [Adlercreutzia equolifaciens]MDE8701478.1 peptidylprolyl isomerase [Adlercreutzia equolifaciens]
MKKKGGQLAAVVAAGLLAASLLSACSSNDERLAMKVNGEGLPAAVLEGYVDSIKEGIEATSDEAFEAYVDLQGTTMEEYWTSLLDFYGTEMVVTQRCEELGIDASPEEIEEAQQNYWQFLGVSSEEGYVQALEALGTTVDEMSVSLSYGIRQKKLFEEEVPREAPSQEFIDAYADEHGQEYEAVDFSYIYMPAGNLAKMQEILKELQADSDADFAALAREYSQSTTVEENGGDFGWITTAALGEQFSEPLATLAPGQLLDEVLLIDDGLYILKKTGEYTPGDPIDLDAMPDPIRQQLEESAEASYWDDLCQAYLEDLYDAADVEILIPTYYDL